MSLSLIKAFATNAVLLTDLVTSQAEGPPRKDKKEERRKRGGTEKKGQRGKGADVEQEEEEEGSKRGTSSELHLMTTEEVCMWHFMRITPYMYCTCTYYIYSCLHAYMMPLINSVYLLLTARGVLHTCV